MAWCSVTLCVCICVFFSAQTSPSAHSWSRSPCWPTTRTGETRTWGRSKFTHPWRRARSASSHDAPRSTLWCTGPSGDLDVTQEPQQTYIWSWIIINERNISEAASVEYLKMFSQSHRPSQCWFTCFNNEFPHRVNALIWIWFLNLSFLSLAV